jgi:hypothetical protein
MNWQILALFLLLAIGFSTGSFAAPINVRQHDGVSPSKLVPTGANITGNWTNERGSKMQLKVLGGQAFEGSYFNAVGDTKLGTIVGKYLEATHGVLVTFEVSWTHSQPLSLTTWAGEMWFDDSGALILDCLWLLIRDESYGNGWSNTIVNKDKFNKDSS